MLEILGDRLLHAANEHPEGANFDALVEEVEEVRVEYEKGRKLEMIYELYDVMTVAYRMIKDLENTFDSH